MIRSTQLLNSVGWYRKYNRPRMGYKDDGSIAK